MYYRLDSQLLVGRRRRNLLLLLEGNTLNTPDICLDALHDISFFFFCLFRATPRAHRGFQARGRIGAVATGLHHSHSNTRSELHLQPTSQLTATPDP